MEGANLTSSFLLCLDLSSERWEKEKDELLPFLEAETKKRKVEKMELPQLVEEEEEESKESKKSSCAEKVKHPTQPEEKKKKTKKTTTTTKMKREKKEIQVAQHLPTLFVDLNEEPCRFWNEMKASKPTFVFNRMLTDSDARRDLARCILNHREMSRVLIPALRKEEVEEVFDKERKLRVMVVDDRGRQCEMKLVWWRSLKQFALVCGWTEFACLNGLAEGDTIQVSYFRFGEGNDEEQLRLGFLIDCRPELKVPEEEEENTIEG